VTAVTDQDHTEHADQQEDGATKDDEREHHVQASAAPVEGASENGLPAAGDRVEGELDAGEDSAAAEESEMRKLWRKLAKQECRAGDDHARVDAPRPRRP
jgi:hypothetical protein